ncbi:MAG: 5'-nucleotidase C-terminal domain-containing protein [Chloracidobacterium sp.]|nr:5'-nucleotidase C-terminal domain-containing protein [Chloracidobacterium sp.]
MLEKLAVKVGATSVQLDALSQSNRQKETNIGNFIADSYRNAVNADIGFVNGGSIRADMTYEPGPLTKRDVLSILPFNNPIVKIEVSGKLLLRIIEHGVARSGPGEDNEPGRFPQISGLTLSMIPANRPVSVSSRHLFPVKGWSRVLTTRLPHQISSSHAAGTVTQC